MGDSKIVSEKEVRAHPLHLFQSAPALPHSPLRSHAAMGFFWPRTDESSGVENTSYVLASERPHSD